VLNRFLQKTFKLIINRIVMIADKQTLWFFFLFLYSSYHARFRRIKLVAATTPTLIKDLVLTLFNIFDLLSIKTKSRIPDKAWKKYHRSKNATRRWPI